MAYSEKGYYLSLTTKGALIISSPGVAPLLLDSWHSPHKPAFPSVASRTSDVGRGEKFCCPGSAAKIRGDHESTQRHPCHKYGNRNGWVLSQRLWAQSQQNCPTSLAPESFLHFVCRFGPQSSTGLTHVTLIAACVTGVPNRGTVGTASALLAPTGSKHHLIL